MGVHLIPLQICAIKAVRHEAWRGKDSEMGTEADSVWKATIAVEECQLIAVGRA